MKTILLKSIAGIVIFISSLAACTGSPSRQMVPTEAAFPTIAPTSTISPTPRPRFLGEYELLSPEDMRFDLNELFHRIEMTHPNPYAKRSKAEVDLERQLIYDELAQPMNMFEFYGKVNRLINSLGDYHTQVYMPQNMGGDIERELYFPLELKFDGQKWFITNNYSGNPGSPLGAEVLSINGTALSHIQSSLVSSIRSGYPFPFALWFVYGSIPQYQLEILRPGETTPLVLEAPGIGFKKLIEHMDPVQPRKPVTYERIPGEPIGVLTINTFKQIGPLLKPAFAQIQKDGVQHLIFDIRANGGGDEPSNLMDYLTDQPYGLCAKYYEAPFKGYGSGQPREKDCELIQPFDAAERFKGKLYLLIGPDTFSAAITFATILQDYHLAPLIGEQTTDMASYCAGTTVVLPLPRTKLEYRVSTKCFVRPNGLLDDQPVIPDFLEETTVADQIAGKDPVLDYTLELIRNGDQIP